MFQGFWKQPDQRNQQQGSAAGSGPAVSTEQYLHFCVYNIIATLIVEVQLVTTNNLNVNNGSTITTLTSGIMLYATEGYCTTNKYFPIIIPFN